MSIKSVTAKVACTLLLRSTSNNKSTIVMALNTYSILSKRLHALNNVLR